MAIKGIQSVDRSLEVLRIVAEHQQITATELAGILGIHQSSASRHLKSLHNAGYIRKPDFHSFAPDYGILLFAGTAMKAFPLVDSAAEVCADLRGKHGLGATVAVLVNNRLVYLTWISPDDGKPFHIVDASDYPIFKSSLGLILSFKQDADAFKTQLLADPSLVPGEAQLLFDTVAAQMSQHGFIYLRDFHGNRFNAAICLDSPGDSRPAALAIFSRTRFMDEPTAKTLLKSTIERINPGKNKP